MNIYGVALLAFCYLAGKILGYLLGNLLNFDVTDLFTMIKREAV